MRKEKKEKMNKAVVPYNIPMLMACVLFCLTLVSTHFTSNLYARYTTSDTASDSARVAKFGTLTLTETVDGEVVGKNHTFTVMPGVDINKQVTVSYTGGETDVFVFVAVERGNWNLSTTKKITETYGFEFAAGTDHMIWAVDEMQWNRLGSYNGEEVYYLRVKANNKLDNREVIRNGKVLVNELNKENLENTLKITELNFRAAVVQYGEFGSTIKTEPKFAEAAWKSINGIT